MLSLEGQEILSPLKPQLKDLSHLELEGMQPKAPI
jgi:hypothetical protein